jgi:hypothetical protein
MTQKRHPLAVLLALAAATALAAQDARPIAFTNARLVTVSGGVIERGTLVVKSGVIDALGADTVAPAGARIVDATGMTILPGLVSAFARAGLAGPGPQRPEERAGGRRGGRGAGEGQPAPGGSGAQNKAATKVVESLYGRQPVFGDLLRAGVTSLALTPTGSAFPGLGALLRPDGKTLAQLTVDDDAFVFVGMARDKETKRLLKEQFEKAQKLVEERTKPPAAPKPAEAPPADAKPADAKPGEVRTEPPKGNEPPKPPTPSPTPTPTPSPTPSPAPKPEEGKEAPAAAPAAAAKKPEPPKDPNLDVLADLLQGTRRAIVQIDSAADLLHWQQAVAEGVKFPRAVVIPRHDPLAGTADVVLEPLRAMQCPVLLAPELSTLPRSRHLIHPSKRLHDAGIEIGFVVGDQPAAVRLLFFKLMDLVRCGLPADVALRAVTLVPAKALGIDAKVGSLEVGKHADLLLFHGDPLTPTGELHAVWLAGREVPRQP